MHSFWTVLLILEVQYLVCTGTSTDTFLTPVNCDKESFGSTSCGGTIAPYAWTKYPGTSYPEDGFCMVKNATQGVEPGVIAYHFKQPICAYYPVFGGGIFFNFQDQWNYDVFYTYSEHSQVCILGYMEMGILYNITTFVCKLGEDRVDWLEFGIDIANGSARATLKSYFSPLEPIVSHEYTPHFEMTPLAGPVQINSERHHSHLHFDNSTMDTVTCQDAPELCNPCDFAYNIQSQPMYPLPDYRNFLLWYPRALEMVYTSCYFKVMLEQDDGALINASSKVGTFEYNNLIKVGDFYGERHACIANKAACLQIKAAGSVTNGDEIHQDRTLISIIPLDKAEVSNIKVNDALQLIYGNSIVDSEPREFSMYIDERVYGSDFGIYCHTSKSVYEAQSVSENMCLSGNNRGYAPPDGGIVQQGWAVKFY